MSSTASHSAGVLRPVVIDTTDGPLEVSPFLLAAVIRNAERMALFVSAALGAASIPPQGAQLPRGFLLELGAVLQLGVWERQGLHRHAELGLPIYSEAAHELATRAAKGPAAFEGPDATTLSRQVMQVQLDHFAWDGPELLHADLVVGDIDEDAFAEALADFLWTHRHDLDTLLFGEEE